MKKKLFVLFLSAVMALSMSACGSSDDARIAPKMTESNPDYEELAEYYVFELGGDEYSLPCKLSEFSENGWYIDPEDLYYSVRPTYIHDLIVYTDSSMDTEAFELIVTNSSSETKNANDCNVYRVELNKKGSVHSLKLKKAGVWLDISSKKAALQSVEDLKAAYGTDEDVLFENHNDDTYNVTFTLKDMFKYDPISGRQEGTSIYIFTDGYLLVELLFQGLPH